MHCLLCHEKIPRLRAWTSKSEFCSDEHAALYKRQTLERLLTSEPEAAPAHALAARAKAPANEAPPLSQSTEAVLVSQSGSRRRVQNAEPPTRAEVDQLWQIAEEVGQPRRTETAATAISSSPDRLASHDAALDQQDAAEALAALRAISAGGSNGAVSDDLPELPPLSELDDREAASLEVPADLDLDALDAAAEDANPSLDPPELLTEGPLVEEIAGADALEAPAFDCSALVDAGAPNEIEAPELEVTELSTGTLEPSQAEPEAPEFDALDLLSGEASESEASAPAVGESPQAAAEQTESAQDLRELSQALVHAEVSGLQAPSVELLNELEPGLETELEPESEPPAPDMELLAALDELTTGAEDQACDSVATGVDPSAKVLEFPAQRPSPVSVEKAAVETDTEEESAGDKVEEPLPAAATPTPRRGGLRFRPAARLIGLQPTEVECGPAEWPADHEPYVPGSQEILAPHLTLPNVEPLMRESRPLRGGGFAPCLTALTHPADPDFDGLAAMDEAAGELMTRIRQEPLKPRDAVVRTPPPETGAGARVSDGGTEGTDDPLQAADGN